jgi:Dodecin
MTIVPSMLPSPGFLAVRRQDRRNAFGRHQQHCDKRAHLNPNVRGRAAVETAAGTLRDLRVAEVTQMDMKLENGKVSAFRTRVSLSFKYEA